jgi:hypothetical protein
MNGVSVRVVGTKIVVEVVHFLAPEAVEWMYRHAEGVIYPPRDGTRQPAGGDRLA